MNLQSYLHFTIFLLFLAFSIYALSKKVKSRLHQYYSALFLCLALWSFSFACINNPYVPGEVIIRIINITSIANLGFAVFFFMAIIVFTGQTKYEYFLFTVFIFYLIIAVYFQYKGELAYPSGKDNDEGYWIISYKNKLITIFYNVIHNGLIIYSFIRLYTFSRKTCNKLNKYQAKIIVYTGLISFLLGFVNVYSKHIFENFEIPLIPDVFLLILAVGIIYSIAKLELFEVSPVSAAKKIVEIMPAGLILSDADNNIQFMNKSMEQICGYKNINFYNKSFLYWQTTVSDSDNNLINKQNINNHHFKLKSKKNNHIDLLVSKKILFDQFGTKAGDIWVFKDITAYKKIEAKLIDLNKTLEKKVKERTKQLARSKQLAEEGDRLKTAFLQNMSHEIRTPMNAIVGFAELLLKKRLTEDKKHYYAQIIISNSRQLLRIINDILDISDIEARSIKFQKEPVDVNELICELYATYEPVAKSKKIELKQYTDNSGKRYIIHTDKERLYQIFNNLLNNAFKFTQAGSVDFGYMKQNNETRFFVKDTGIGIAPGFHDKIFKRFQQVEYEIDKRAGGTGLGLAISKKLITALGGHIRVESEEGKGAAFYFTIEG